MIYKIINYELVKYESWASVLLESYLLVHPIPPLFLWFLKQTHCSSVGGRLPLALKGSPQQVIVLPYTFLWINRIRMLASLLLVSMPC